ncbi:MAG: hypothetical protein A2233_05015 [Candidatus Kerfeldbacteria bacterium RIFOXYA2_FULL_38_24]|uniref:ABC3 transporter permease protein domain-containing protein n=1 Tax=Candidatus Kerfeldbacteria bacterium RIFOXYB2_FULL_38_14 TaxID=1798547 RepID=A0A1G2BAE4_9BACT|nr:MAG: hypothetical protein A2233_05015 [Candidatus Kerfeldbacteria bacterium RIFOXYA2_FULL_38_24]OGY85686.1 MAG: hypothetical protein A2319_05285 [Candidatus Kerfeldbacteria bacterium RIFOXYB2_FULL_38_14]OGY88372.1 MAG: hypothetical protein A2458_02820 [Candidatus Kerfeldbacteria bacterium RIFOXYC2_FULL_38_9]
MKRYLRTIRVGVFLTVRSITRGSIGTTVMTVFMMAMIFMNLIFLTAIINGLTNTAQKQIINTLTGHVLVEAPAGELYMPRANYVYQQLLDVPGVQNISARTNFSAEITISGEQGSYRGVAIDPAQEAMVTTVAEHIVSGRYLKNDDTNKLILGNQVAGDKNNDVEMQAYSLKGAQVGDWVNLQFSNGRSQRFEVVGIFDTDFVQADNRFFISQQEFFALFKEYKNHASEFAVKITPTADVNTVADDIKALPLKIKTRTWKETAGIVDSFTSSFDMVNVIVSFAGLLVAGITIFIVMYIDVINRKRQIGILRAIGITENSIALSYLMRALLYAFFGVILGMLIFKFAIIPLFLQHPLKLPVGQVSLMIAYSLMYVRALALFVVAFLGSYIPIQRVLRMHIIEAIWGK